MQTAGRERINARCKCTRFKIIDCRRKNPCPYLVAAEDKETVHLMSFTFFVMIALLAGVALWLSLKFWRQGRGFSSSSADPDVKVKSELTIARDQGWTFLNLAVLNRSRMKAWVVDATASLSGLQANFQASLPSKQETLKIRRVVGPRESLLVSLIELFYSAAGRPQGAYSFVVNTTIRYRAHGDLFEQVLPAYRVSMTALTAVGLQRIRATGTQPQPSDLPHKLPELEVADLQWLERESRSA
jgi:hypothetical protein